VGIKIRTLGPWKGKDVKWEHMAPEQEQLIVWNALFECVKVLQDPYLLYSYTQTKKTYYGAFVDFVMDDNKLTFFRNCRPIWKELLKVDGTMIIHYGGTDTPFSTDEELLWIAIKQSRHAFSAENQ
jgi:hypothetical protein